MIKRAECKTPASPLPTVTRWASYSTSWCPSVSYIRWGIASSRLHVHQGLRLSLAHKVLTTLGKTSVTISLPLCCRSIFICTSFPSRFFSLYPQHLASPGVIIQQMFSDNHILQVLTNTIRGLSGSEL